MRSRLLVVPVASLPILLAAGGRVWSAPAAPPLRTVGFLVLPGVYNSELMAWTLPTVKHRVAPGARLP